MTNPNLFLIIVGIGILSVVVLAYGIHLAVRNQEKGLRHTQSGRAFWVTNEESKDD